MPDISVSFSFDLLLVIVAAVGLAALAFSAYTITIPPIPTRFKIVLIGLRSALLILLFLLVAEPVVELTHSSEERPVIAVLVDESKSMSLMDRAGIRYDELNRVLTSDEFASLASVAELHVYPFSRNARIVEPFDPESLRFSGDMTDLALSLEAVQDAERGANIRGVILLSDGIRTVGSSPLQEAQRSTVPILAVGIGDTTARRDVAIRSVLTNSIVYTGTVVPVRVSISNSGFSDQPIEVLLNTRDGTVDRTIVTLQEDVGEYRTELSFTPSTTGTQRLWVELVVPSEDAISENNRRSTFTKVLESKLQVVLLAGAPDPDVAFVRRELESDENMELSVFIEKGDGTFYDKTPGSAEIGRADCLILIGYPGTRSSPAILESVEAGVTSGIGVFLIMSRRLDLEALRKLESYLPFVVTSATHVEYEAFVSMAPEQQNNPLLRFSNEVYTESVWRSLPPLFKRQARLLPKPESQVLALVRLQQQVLNEPVLMTRNAGGKKSVALLAYGIWRWRMHESSVQGGEGFTGSILANAVRWLSVREDERPVRVQPVSEFFSGGDPVEFIGQVYDESFTPLDDVRVQVEIVGTDGRRELQLDPKGNGQYGAAIGGVAEGEYTYTATVTRRGLQLGRDQGTFAVGDVTVEYLDPQADLLLLRQIADRSGGIFYGSENFPDLVRDLPDNIELRSRTSRSISRFELWNLEWILVLLILIPALEWFLRKRRGLL